MFSPAVSALNGQNISVTFAAPKEGYIGWHGIICLSSASQGRSINAAYDYMNRWLSGWLGVFVAKQSYYICNPEHSISFSTQPE
jgi:putative spermidine/putrescine transport system substrate-binding protein